MSDNVFVKPLTGVEANFVIHTSTSAIPTLQKNEFSRWKRQICEIITS
jgi:hypothetical protein